MKGTRTETPEALAARQVSLHMKENVQMIGYPRASSLYDACMRMHVIGTKRKLIRKEYLSLKERIIFGIGNAVHSWAQNSTDLFGDNRIGWWRCSACGTILYFGLPPTIELKKDRCPKCKSHVSAIEYHEHHFKIKKPFRVSGHPDLFISIDGKRRPVELKTINGNDYDSLIVPKIEHVWQVHTYMWALKKEILPLKIDHKRAYIVYVTKLVRPKEFPVKSFPVDYDPSIIKRILNKLRDYKFGMKNYPDNIPKRVRECERNPNSWKTRQCPAMNECMSIND